MPKADASRLATAIARDPDSTIRRCIHGIVLEDASKRRERGRKEERKRERKRVTCQLSAHTDVPRETATTMRHLRKKPDGIRNETVI